MQGGRSEAVILAAAPRERGFTLIELLVTMAVVSILAATAMPAYSQYRSRAWDAAARVDLRNAMTAVEAAIASTGAPPTSQSQLPSYGHRLSPGVAITRYSVETRNGVASAHIHVKHAGSSNSWHAHYPADGSEIEIR